jgi:hypothetical protein
VLLPKLLIEVIVEVYSSERRPIRPHILRRRRLLLNDDCWIPVYPLDEVEVGMVFPRCTAILLPLAHIINHNNRI